MLFAARIVDGLSGGNISTARAYVADITPPERRAEGKGSELRWILHADEQILPAVAQRNRAP